MSITHDSNNNQFTLQLEGLEGVLQYHLLGNDGVDFFRTYVPPALRGRGHSERLVDAGLCWAREQSLNITASCWYVTKRLDEG
ncbi:MAG: GNAT family N-acetyltransferase [Pseudomonadales bacterium]